MNKKIILAVLITTLMIGSVFGSAAVIKTDEIVSNGSNSQNNGDDWDAQVVFNFTALKYDDGERDYRVKIESFTCKSVHNRNKPFKVEITVKYDIGTSPPQDRKMEVDWSFEVSLFGWFLDYESDGKYYYEHYTTKSWWHEDDYQEGTAGEKTIQVNLENLSSFKINNFRATCKMVWYEWEWDYDENKWKEDGSGSYLDDPNLYSSRVKRVAFPISRQSSRPLFLNFLERFPLLERLLNLL